MKAKVPPKKTLPFASFQKFDPCSSLDAPQSTSFLLTQTKAAMLSRCDPDRLGDVNSLSKIEEDGDGAQKEKLLVANHSSWSQLGTSAVA